MPLTRIRQTAIGNDSITSAKLAHDLDLDGDFVRVPHGTTAQRPSSPVAGYMRFNTDLGTLEQWNTTTNSWQAIDSPPIITSLAYSGSATAADPAGGETITITGTNFKSGATVTVGGTSATSVSVVNSTSITFTTPVKTAGDYDVVVVNANGLQATLSNGISYNGTPSFTTAAGNIGSISEDVAMSTITIVATEPDGGTLAYSITSGALPTGVSMSSVGAITGTPNVNPTSDTTFNFTVTATDDESQTNSRAFNLIVLRPVYATQISNSLLFNDDDTQYLTRTPSSAGNQDMWTWSGWVKRGNIGFSQILFGARSGTSFTQFYFNGSDKIVLVDWSGSQNWGGETSAVFRDVSGWYHLTLTYDSAQATAANRYKVYVNGTQQTISTLSGYPSAYPDQNEDSKINSTYEHAIGRTASISSDPFDGYMSDIHFIDSQVLTPTVFAEEFNGVWVPKSFSGTYGTNGYHLEFGDSSAIGDDTSGNTNDWTPNNFGVWNVVTDTPTNNFPVTNRIARYTSGNFSKGNLTTGPVAGGTGYSGPHGSTFKLTSGKWYCEMRVAGDAPSSHFAGAYVYRNDDSLRLGREIASPYSSQIYSDGSVVQSGLPSASLGTVYGFAVDVDSKTCQVYKDGSALGTQIDWSGHTYADNGFVGIGHYHGSSSNSSIMTANYGQNPTFGNTTTAGGNADENGIGNFKYSVPSGFLAMCQKNLAEPSIDVKTNERPEDYFNVVTYSGTSAVQSITVGFQPDFTWLKRRDGTGANTLYDSVRGTPKRLFTNSSEAESAAGDGFTDFNSTGFDLTGTPSGGDVNTSGRTYVGWNWKAGGQPSATNTNAAGAAPVSGSVMVNGVASTSALAGSIAARHMSVNTKSGFSIVNWAGNTTAGATVAHGLNSAPELIIFKRRDGISDWHTYHKDLGNTYLLYLNTTAASASSGSFLNSTTPSNTVVTLGTSSGTNGSDMIMYCFHSVPGFSKIGFYQSSGFADGVFVDLGFKPAWVLIKSNSAGRNWTIWDNVRGHASSVGAGNNPNTTTLFANAANAETHNTGYAVDFTANGFKTRGQGGEINTTNEKMMFMAFAEDPFKYSEAE